MNPYTILAAVLAAVALFAGGDHLGHRRGINEQKVTDQARFDRINADLTEQKAAANAVYRKIQQDNVDQLVKQDQLKTDLEKSREKNRLVTNSLRDQYAGQRLRFQPDPAAGRGIGRCTARAPGPDAPGPAAAPVVELPDTIASDLRSLAYDADTLADEYRKCFDYVGEVSKK